MKRMTTAYVSMNPSLCTACWECVEMCPEKVIDKSGFFLHRHVIFQNADACVGCGKCIKTCPNNVFSKLDKTVSVSNESIGINFYIERLLPIAFLASAVTGIGLHIAGHSTSNEVLHNWRVSHILASSLWLLSVAVHVKRHRFWYKTLISKGVSNKRWITLLLSIFFTIVAITGILLIAFIKETPSSIGSLHHKFGILLLVFTLIHSLHRK